MRYAQEEIEASESDGEKNIERMTFRPYDALVPNDDGCAKEYPLSFIWSDFKDSCIRYTMATGSCKTGLRFLHVRYSANIVRPERGRRSPMSVTNVDLGMPFLKEI